MLINITRTTRLGITRPGSPPLQVEEVCCLSRTPEEYRTLPLLQPVLWHPHDIMKAVRNARASHRDGGGM